MKKYLFTILIALGLFLGYAGVASAATLTVYPDPDVETTSVDGYSFLNNANYTTTRNAAAGQNAADNDGELQIENGFGGAGSTYNIGRSFVLFDTSALTSGATISAAVLSLNSGGAKDGTTAVDIVSGSPASNTAIVADDYDQCGSTSFGSIASTSNGYNDFTLSAAGIATISKTGVSKFCARHNGDLNNTTPAARHYSYMRSADLSGTSTDPKLVVTYTVGRKILLPD